MNTSQLATFASLPATGGAGSTSGNTSGSWFEAMAAAWGQALDKQAASIEAKSAEVSGDGGDNPSGITELTAMSLKMSFLSSSSHTALSSVGNALETMARKQ